MGLVALKRFENLSWTLGENSVRTVVHVRSFEGTIGPTKRWDITKPFSLDTIPKLPLANVLTTKAPLGLISRQLDEMLSTWFSPHKINYKWPKGFLVPKFMMYDGVSDPFIPFDALLVVNDAGYRQWCVVQSLSDQPWWSNFFLVPLTLAKFYQFLLGCLRGFCRPLFMFYSPKVKYKHT